MQKIPKGMKMQAIDWKKHLQNTRDKGLVFKINS